MRLILITLKPHALVGIRAGLTPFSVAKSRQAAGRPALDACRARLAPLAPSLALLLACLLACLLPAGLAPARAADADSGTGGLQVSDTMAQRIQACTPCHGAEGRAAPDGYYPRIAGKPAGYLFEQLRSFRDGRRNQAAMSHLLSYLSDDYLKALARYFADLDLPYPPSMPPGIGGAVLARGEALVRHGDEKADLPSCTSCHGEAMTGREPGTPGLLGLPRDYLVAQIGAWQTHQRRGIDPDCMADVARRLKPEDVLAVTTWLSARPVPAHAKAAPDDGHELPLRCAAVGQPTAASEAAAAAAAAATPAARARAEAGGAAAERIARGAYLAQAGNCIGCHTARGGMPYAGGRGIETPFGTVHAGNLTPDAETGLGQWSLDDFRRALRDGRSRDGHLLYPAFPYQNYGLLSDEDTEALFAFLQSLPPIRQPNPPHALRFPYNLQLALRAWRILFFEPARYQPQPDQSAEWNRGDYLIRGLGHCDACHSPRNLLGAIRGKELFEGGEMPGQSWYAPSLKSGAEAGVGDWPVEQIVALLRDGVATHGSATGPMAEVVASSTRHLDEADLIAMAIRLKALANGDDHGASPSAGGGPAGSAGALHRGAALYREYCSDCHGKDGRGAPGIYPALAGNRAVMLPVATNLIRMVAEGGFPPSTAGNPQPFGMPPFGQQLQSGQIADVITHIRQSWGNEASAVTPNEVIRARP